MKKNVIFSLISLPLFCLAFFLWIFTVAPARVMDYANSSIEPKLAIDKLDFVGIRDAPGYLSAMGRGDAKDLVEKALDDERIALDKMDFFGRSLVNNSELLQCASQLHFQRLEFFQRILNFPKSGLIEASDARKMLAEGKDLALLGWRCNHLARVAKDWRVRLGSGFGGKDA